MKVITVRVNSKTKINLGHEGENLATQVRFNIAPWQEEFGAGSAQLLAQRANDEDPYPVAVEIDTEGYALWSVSNADTAQPGSGYAEIRYYVDEVLVKSNVFTTIVSDALGEASPEPPEPYQDWVDQVLQAGADAEQAAESAEQSAEAARQAAEMFPAGGTTGQILAKASDADYDTHWIDNEGGGGALPPGGTDGQYLVRSAAAQMGAVWRDLPIYDGSYEVTPLPHMETVMQTQRTYLDRDIVVKEIPYAEVTNEKGGLTATIGG